MIDNSLNVYIPFRLKCGITAQCRLEVFDTFPEILDVIEEDVFNCIRALPPSVHDLVRRTNVWINVSYVYGPLDRPKELKHTTTHHYERWLIWYANYFLHDMTYFSFFSITNICIILFFLVKFNTIHSIA